MGARGWLLRGPCPRPGEVLRELWASSLVSRRNGAFRPERTGEVLRVPQNKDAGKNLYRPNPCMRVVSLDSIMPVLRDPAGTSLSPCPPPPGTPDPLWCQLCSISPRTPPWQMEAGVDGSPPGGRSLQPGSQLRGGCRTHRIHPRGWIFCWLIVFWKINEEHNVCKTPAGFQVGWSGQPLCLTHDGRVFSVSPLLGCPVTARR